eukprot:CAMPEP_0203880174 /NCGR_PEP_ID=MMETSP0359-20131031/24582_1 /ASSEMBLY_ACC=CAM_ASM_000338 /TAXON_ID=268821 /ORGANISM="Scrippsiella Hangoei, Strain SHTV-5" /LENGTH=74 /DNA_ID=CAMNT_0050799747 /DNA_START=1 /DNA_END=221 /DNA_ORIENTATION=+
MGANSTGLTLPMPPFVKAWRWRSFREGIDLTFGSFGLDDWCGMDAHLDGCAFGSRDGEGQQSFRFGGQGKHVFA